MDRRSFLRTTGAAALTPAIGSLLAACGIGDDRTQPASATARATAGSRTVNLGFISLTDCASIVMAHELGYFTRRGLDVNVIKQASWAATRDNILNGDLDGAHCLYSMPFSVAAGVGGSGSRDLKIAMMLSSNGQGITMSNDFDGVGYHDLDAVRGALDGAERTLAMTFPGGTHDLWLQYWLLAAGVDLKAHKIITIPPPQMVANMKVGAMDAYSVGAPWNAVGVDESIGFTAVNSQDVWQHHPEKALVVNTRFAQERRAVLADVMGAIFEASRWLDDLSNRAQTAQVLGAEAYVNTDPAGIVGQLEGRFDLGGGREKTYDEDLMVFHRDGLVNAPRRSHAIWALAQYQRFGYLAEAPPYGELADELILRDLYEEVAAAEGVDVPDDDMAPFEVRIDGALFDPAQPEEEAARP